MGVVFPLNGSTKKSINDQYGTVCYNCHILDANFVIDNHWRSDDKIWAVECGENLIGRIQIFDGEYNTTDDVLIKINVGFIHNMTLNIDNRIFLSCSHSAIKVSNVTDVKVDTCSCKVKCDRHWYIPCVFFWHCMPFVLILRCFLNTHCNALFLIYMIFRMFFTAINNVYHRIYILSKKLCQT